MLLKNKKETIYYSGFSMQPPEGVELLKICSRYRFLVGVGRMFDFKDVRRKIESKICDNHKGD